MYYWAKAYVLEQYWKLGYARTTISNVYLDGLLTALVALEHYCWQLQPKVMHFPTDIDL